MYVQGGRPEDLDLPSLGVGERSSKSNARSLQLFLESQATNSKSIITQA